MEQDELQNKAVKDMAEQKENENKLNEDIFTQAMANEDYPKAREAFKKLPLTKQNSLQNVLDQRGPIVHPTVLTQEQREIQSNLITNAENGSLTMEELLKNRKNILYATFKTLVKKVNANLDSEFTNRSALFVGKYKLNDLVRDLSDREEKDRQIALQIKQDVYDKYIEAKAKNETFDIRSEFKRQEQELIIKINQEIDNKLLNKKDEIIDEVSKMSFGTNKNFKAKQLLTLEQAIQFLTYIKEKPTEAGKKYNSALWAGESRRASLLEELKRIKELESQ
jgi:hypothetical protein